MLKAKSLIHNETINSQPKLFFGKLRKLRNGVIIGLPTQKHYQAHKYLHIQRRQVSLECVSITDHSYISRSQISVCGP